MSKRSRSSAPTNCYFCFDRSVILSDPPRFAKEGDSVVLIFTKNNQNKWEDELHVVHRLASNVPSEHRQCVSYDSSVIVDNFPQFVEEGVAVARFIVFVKGEWTHVDGLRVISPCSNDKMGSRVIFKRKNNRQQSTVAQKNNKYI